MKQFINGVVRPVIRKCGIDIVQVQKLGFPTWEYYPPDFSEQNIQICEAVKSYTMTSPERVNAIIEVVKYIEANRIGGAFVECGVWKGGSVMVMALTLKEIGGNAREIYLYDTFSGMSKPTDVDVSIKGAKAHETFSKSDACLSSLEEVKKNILSTGYPEEKFHFTAGKVEDTIPGNIPEEIALLRLDTDWYESTKHELTHLYPRLKRNGVLIIDDYGHWDGARKAVDQYIRENNLCILLNRIDYTGRIAIKTL